MGTAEKPFRKKKKLTLVWPRLVVFQVPEAKWQTFQTKKTA